MTAIVFTEDFKGRVLCSVFQEHDGFARSFESDLAMSRRIVVGAG